MTLGSHIYLNVEMRTAYVCKNNVRKVYFGKIIIIYFGLFHSSNSIVILTIVILTNITNFISDKNMSEV